MATDAYLHSFAKICAKLTKLELKRLLYIVFILAFLAKTAKPGHVTSSGRFFFFALSCAVYVPPQAPFPNIGYEPKFAVSSENRCAKCHQ